MAAIRVPSPFDAIDFQACFPFVGDTSQVAVAAVELTGDKTKIAVIAQSESCSAVIDRFRNQLARIFISSPLLKIGYIFQYWKSMP